MIIVFILFFHDIGHIFFIKKLGYKIETIEILPFGANIKTNIGLNSDSKDIFLISIAGILMQIGLFLIVFGAYYFNLISNYNYEIFMKYNMFLILFNMLPIYSLDGQKALNSLLELVLSFRLSLFIGYLVSIVSLFIFFLFNYFYNLDNYFIIFFLFFKLIEYIKEYKFIINKFYVERYLSNKTYKKLHYTKSLKGLRKNCWNFINNENERKVLRKKLEKI